MKLKLFVLIGILLFAGFVSADVISINSGGDNQLIINPQTYIEGFFSSHNQEPDNPTPILVSLNGNNESDTDLNCSSLIIDSDNNDSLSVEVNWIKDDISQLNLTYSNIDNATLLSSILDNGNLTLGDVWKCSMRVYDSVDYSSWVDSNELEIIDITSPIINIISPEPINYTDLNVTFNISIIENENVSMCFYDLDSEGNLSMTELNDTYFWFFDNTLGPGGHDIIFYCNDTSGNWGTNQTNFTIENEAAIAILLSDDLIGTVKWNLVTLPVDDLGAIGNNEENATGYYINISATNTLVDIYVRADGDLLTGDLDVLGLGNETFAVSTNDSTVTNVSKQTMSTNYTLIGESLGTSALYLKFYLDAPPAQAAGIYLNQLDFKAVRNGQSV